MAHFSRAAAAILIVAMLLVPAAARAGDATPVTISANDKMQYDVTTLSGKVGQPMTIVLANEGALMPHNVVVLLPGTDVTAFAADAGERTAAEGYIPNGAQAARIVAHTRLVGPGEDDRITFTPSAPGVYEFICTFPGHMAAGMRGKITVQ